jgi:hypothetical protein
MSSRHTPDQIARFLISTGRQGARTLSFLGKHQGIIEAFETEVGKQIMGSAVDRHEELVNKILNSDDATVEEKAERKVLFDLLARWSNLINQYYKAMDFMKEKSEEA